MQELCDSTAIIHHCSRVPGKGLPSFATVMDGSWRKRQESQELQELWPLPSPKLWGYCFNP